MHFCQVILFFSKFRTLTKSDINSKYNNKKQSIFNTKAKRKYFFEFFYNFDLKNSKKVAN